MTEYEFILADRLQKIQSINAQYDLENNAYLSFSGGKDSTVLHYLIDLALPNNKIPRVFLNTGIEYTDILNFVRTLAAQDPRIQIVNSGVNIKQMLETNGFPFKSKEHSQKLAFYQKSGMKKTIVNYLGNGSKSTFLCPNILKYQFTPDFNLKISDKCCSILKKNVAEKWSVENNRKIKITGMRHNEGGLRKSIRSCTIFLDKNCSELKNFHPLMPIEDDWIYKFIKQHNIQLCRLYYPPFNFERTGCKGCPFNKDIQKLLDLMEKVLPNEKKQCEIIWKPIYEEYRRIGYRLKNTGELEKNK